MSHRTAWQRLLHGGGPVEEADPRLARRAFGLLFVSAVVLAWLWIALTPLSGGRRDALIALTGVATVIAVLIFAFGHRLPRSSRAAVLAAVIVLVSAGVGLTGGVHSIFGLLYAWAAAWAVAFLPRRVAFAELGLIVVGYLVAMAAAGSGAELTGASVAVWLFRVATVVAVVAVVGALAAAVERQERVRRRRERQQEVVASLGLDALATDDVAAVVAEAVRRLAERLEVPLAAYLEADQGRRGLIPRATFGWKASELRLDRPFPLEESPQAAQVL
ncbi:MAG TPA: hypothetical protein VGI54_09085, partial [Solirubrobacteraceae bacterium]